MFGREEEMGGLNGCGARPWWGYASLVEVGTHDSAVVAADASGTGLMGISQCDWRVVCLEGQGVRGVARWGLEGKCLVMEWV